MIAEPDARLGERPLTREQRCGHDHGSRRSRGEHPLGDPLDVDPRGLDDPGGQTQEHAAPERALS